MLERVRPGFGLRGTPKLVHGGVSALVLDHMLGEAASEGLSKARFTGTITVKYLRGTRWARFAARRGSTASRAAKSLRAAPFRFRRRHRRGRRCLHRAGVGGGGTVRFYISSAFLNTREIIELAKAADELGYDGIGIPDHVVNLETLDTPYPTPRTGNGAGSPSPTGPIPGSWSARSPRSPRGCGSSTPSTFPRCATRTRRRKPLAPRPFWRRAGWSWASAWVGAARNSR